MNNQTKYYQLTNGYPLEVKLTGNKKDYSKEAIVQETKFGYTKGKTIYVPNLWLFDRK